jgi:FecR protein
LKFDIDVHPAAAAPALPRPRTGVLHKNPERVAWLVIFGAFWVCVALAIAVPLSGRYFLLYSTVTRTGTMQAISPNQDGGGTVIYTPPNAVQPIAIKSDPASFAEGGMIETDQSSRAFITFFDGSTAQVFPGSRLVVDRMRRPRFDWSQLPNMIHIDQRQGLVRYGAASATSHPDNPEGRGVDLEVHTPSFDVTLTEGSYSIEVTGGESQVVVREGSAVVHSLQGDHEVVVGQGQRLQSTNGQALPVNPIPAAQDLIVNGGFSSEILGQEWGQYTDPNSDNGGPKGSYLVVTMGDRRALQILRSGAGTNSTVTGVRQQIDRDASDFRSLVLSADVRLHYQSLSGGGYLSSEYPLILRLKYRDVDGNEWESVHGFYYQNNNQNPTINGERIPQDTWVPYETSNLMQILDPKPFRIISLAVYASGWDYESFISSIKLTFE